MNSSRNECQRISRRVVLTGTALALGAAAIPATVSQTAAQVKISQATARYQGTPKGDQRCEGCGNSNRRMRASSSKATSPRTGGVSCLSRRRRRGHSGAILLAPMPCNDVARSRVASIACAALARGAPHRQAASAAAGQIKPREPRRPQPDATTLRGSAKFAVSPGRRISVAPSGVHGAGSASRRSSILLELGLGGKFQAKSSGWDENRPFLEGDVLEIEYAMAAGC